MYVIGNVKPRRDPSSMADNSQISYPVGVCRSVLVRYVSPGLREGLNQQPSPCAMDESMPFFVVVTNRSSTRSSQFRLLSPRGRDNKSTRRGRRIETQGPKFRPGRQLLRYRAEYSWRFMFMYLLHPLRATPAHDEVPRILCS